MTGRFYHTDSCVVVAVLVQASPQNGSTLLVSLSHWEDEVRPRESLCSETFWV
jgi:hypothetical protein